MQAPVIRHCPHQANGSWPKPVQRPTVTEKQAQAPDWCLDFPFDYLSLALTNSFLAKSLLCT